MTWVWRRDAAVFHTIWILNKAQHSSEPQYLCSLHLLNFIFELALIFMACLSTAAVRMFKQWNCCCNKLYPSKPLLWVSPLGLYVTYWLVPKICREHFACWNFQLGVPAQCWLTGRTWVCALVSLSSKAMRGAAWEAEPLMLPQMDVKTDCYHPRWFFCLGSANAMASSQRPA